MQAPFTCRVCGYQGQAMMTDKISTGGWVVFVILLVCCFVLCWIGLLMRTKYAVCPQCKTPA